MTASPVTYVGVAIAAGRMTVALKHGHEPQPVVVVHDQALQVSDPFPVVAAIAESVRDICRGLGDGPTQPSAIGLSIGGHISEDGLHVRFAPGLIEEGNNWRDEPIGEYISKALSVPAVVENDVNCMTEYQRRLGQGEGKQNFLVVYLAPDVRGLGCGIVAGGELVRGATGGAGEFGHTVIQPEGPRCRCKNRGCLEAMLHVHNFDRDLNWGGQTYGTGFEAGARLAAGGHERARRVFARGGRYLGQGLANAINLLNPELVILGAQEELVQASPPPGSSAEFFMEAMREALKVNAFGVMGADCEVLVATLDLEVAARGASLLAESRAAANKDM
jgi:predicted NBD/HSP70 family sugar kinase